MQNDYIKDISNAKNDQIIEEKGIEKNSGNGNNRVENKTEIGKDPSQSNNKKGTKAGKNKKDCIIF